MPTDKHINAANKLIGAIASLESIIRDQFVAGVDTIDNFIAMSGTDRTEIENALTAKGLTITEVASRITALRNLRDYVNANTSFPPNITM